MSGPAYSMQTALALVCAADAHAREQGLKALGIVALAPDATVMAALSQDGATSFRFEVARAKAHGALQMGRHSRELEAMAAERPALVSSLLQVDSARIVLAAGGVLIANDAGVLVGAIGISGDSSDNDEACAFAAIRKTGLSIHGQG